MLAGLVDYSKIGSFNTCDKKDFQGASETPRIADEKIDFIFPAVVFPSNRLYFQWGEENIRKMVLHHHKLLRKSSVGNLFPKDHTKFEFATNKTADFFVEALGGGKIYSSFHGHPALRMRHFQMTVDEKAREIWLMMYKKTILDLSMPDEFREEFWNWIEPLSIRMINRRTTVGEIERFYYSVVFSK